METKRIGEIALALLIVEMGRKLPMTQEGIAAYVRDMARITKIPMSDLHEFLRLVHLKIAADTAMQKRTT